jgi:hypothetical protein
MIFMTLLLNPYDPVAETGFSQKEINQSTKKGMNGETTWKVSLLLGRLTQLVEQSCESGIVL